MDNTIFIFLSIVSYTLLINLDSSIALDSEPIIGGEDAQAGEYLYTVSIQTENEHTCTGSMLDEYHVITAAHCVATPEGEFFDEPMLVVGGTTDLNAESPKRRDIYVEKVYVPDRYFKDGADHETGDIAILKLRQAVHFGPNSRLQLPTLGENHDGLTAIVTGFGWNEITSRSVDELTNKVTENGVSYRRLRFAHAKILTREQCMTEMMYMKYFAHMCAHIIQRKPNVTEGVCNGDSGGPLVVKGNVIVGVVNGSPPGCNEKVAAASYARVASFLTFINKALKDEYDSILHSTYLPIPKPIGTLV